VAARVPTGELQVQLDYPLPSTVAVGRGTALFTCGWCFSPRARIRALELVVDGSPQPLMAHGMPRGDVFRALHPAIDPSDAAAMASDPGSAEDPLCHSFRSGFWGMARIDPGEDHGDRELVLRATLEDGETASAELGRIATTGSPAEPIDIDAPEPGGGPLVAICMATYDPPPELFRRQLDSIRAQTHRNWVCVISDDCSRPDHIAAIAEAVEGDPRFVVSRSPRRLHFYRNFERALALAPAAASYVAMADQDDFWHPDKLESLLAAIGDAQLVYSDQRIVSPEGDLIANTYWNRRRPNHGSLLSLLVANSVTGAASLFPRELLDSALPFPPRQFTHFHDHWLALTAASLGEIAFVDRPLYDYVQHGGAVLGHAAANRMPAVRDRIAKLREDPRDRVRRWRLHYFVDCCRLIQFTTVLKMRCGPRMSPAKRRALDSFPRAERSPVALANLARRAGRELVGQPETLGAELALSFAFAWRRLVVAATRGLERPRQRLRIDARPPTTLVQVPGRTASNSVAVGTVAAKIAPVELAVEEDGPSRVNILIPTVDLEHFFGGYITKLNLARRLADRGARVRIVTVDEVGVLPSSWRRTLESYSGLDGLFDRVEVVFGRESQGVEVSRSDGFVATTWWTAHIAASALKALGGGRFLYLIQEYEPFTFPMGSYAALASDSYRLPHRAMFSSELLREYFRRHELGVYAAGMEAGDRDSLSFQNAITAIDPPSASELTGRRTRRLLFYARPEPHAARNMFELGVLALSRAVEKGVFGDGWELNGIGTVERERRIELGGGAALNLLPRRKQDAYAKVLREHDLGLALMYTPHPSLVPIEMASAGMATVTNSFENKTREAMAAISPNLITAEPSLESLAAGLAEAADRVEDFEARARGSRVNWSSSWAESFDDGLMARVETLLER
jgi:WsaF, C-terminal domain/WsaF, N-terminal domain/Glycosyl transferase family 2